MRGSQTRTAARLGGARPADPSERLERCREEAHSEGGRGTAGREHKEERNAAGDKADHFPKIAFEGGQGQGKKVVFTVPHENLSPPDFSYIEYMWLKDASSGAIITAKKFRGSDPDLTITGFGNSGQKLTAASIDNKFGLWEGTFIVP